ncbi:MAG: hypothetical protein ACLP01_22855 [Solirubrobacteraceae bacterium]
MSVEVLAVDRFGQTSAPAVRALAGHGASACLAPKTITLVLHATGGLRSAVALLGPTPVANTGRTATTLVVPLAGTLGGSTVLTVEGTTKSGHRVKATDIVPLCSGRAIPTRLSLDLR